jgi:hypothetical protein
MMRVVAVAIVAACGTPYQSMGWYRGGYEDTHMGGRQHLVHVEVNGYTSSATALAYAHRRAREICPAGYDVQDSKIGEHREGKPDATLVVECR